MTAESDTGLPSPDDVIEKFRDLASPNHLGQDSTAIHIRATALITRLKSLNRAANAATRARKQDTAQARQEMDQTHLGLQNLLYEKRHLEREIDKCRQFASIYQDIPLYPVEEFNALAPAESQTTDEHQLMLNRLSFELAERQRLDLKRKELTQQKEELLKESKSHASTMESVQSLIDMLTKTAAEVQKKIHDTLPSSTSNSSSVGFGST